MRPTFTLLIHARGRPDLLAATLAGLRFTLTRDDVECLALSDGASPDVAAMLRAEPGIGRVLVPQGASGIIAARAALLERARGRFAIMITTPARFTDSAWLDRLARALAHESVGMVGPFGGRIESSWQGITTVPSGACDVLTGGPWAMRRDVLLAGAALDPLDGDGGWPDAEQSLQARELGYEVRCTGEIGAMELSSEAPDAAAWATLRARWAGRGLIRAEAYPHSPGPSLPQGERGAKQRTVLGSEPLALRERGWGEGIRPRRKLAG